MADLQPPEDPEVQRRRALAALLSPAQTAGTPFEARPSYPVMSQYTPQEPTSMDTMRRGFGMAPQGPVDTSDVPPTLGGFAHGAADRVMDWASFAGGAAPKPKPKYFVDSRARPFLPKENLPNPPPGAPTVPPKPVAGSDLQQIQDVIQPHAETIAKALESSVPVGYRVQVSPSAGESTYVQVYDRRGRPAFETRVSNHADNYHSSNISVDPAAPNTPQQVVDAFKYHIGESNTPPEVLWSKLDPQNRRQTGGTAQYTGLKSDPNQNVLSYIKQLFAPAGAAAVGAANWNPEEGRPL